MIEDGPSGARFSVRVVPRASRSEIVGWEESGVLKIRLKAPPVDGQANAELIRWLAKVLGVGRNAVQISHGATGRRKGLLIEGVSASVVAGAIDKALK